MKRQTVTLLPAADAEALAACLAVRHAVFTVERGVPTDIETDEHDRPGSGYNHFLVQVNGQDAAAMRCYPKGDTVVLQRFCVLAAFRGQGVGRAALSALEAYYAGQAQRIQLDAKCEARGFYAACGYQTISGVFVEAGVPHVEMEKHL